MVSLTLAAPTANDKSEVSPFDTRDDDIGSDSSEDFSGDDSSDDFSDGPRKGLDTPFGSGRFGWDTDVSERENPLKAIDAMNQKLCEDCNCWLNIYFLPVPGPGRCPKGKCPYKCSSKRLSKGFPGSHHDVGNVG